MADQNDPQAPSQPTQTPPQAQTTPTPVPPTMGLLGTFNAWIKGLWAQYGVLFIVVAILLAIAKWADLMSDLLGWKSKKDLESAEKTDDKLKAEENSANQQANQLVDEAKKLPSQEGQVPDDWFKK